MSYTTSDPRAALADQGPRRTNAANIAPQYFEFGESAPTDSSERGSSSWWQRSQAIVSCYTDAVAGDSFDRHDQPDEYVVLFAAPTSSGVVVAGEEEVEISGRTLVVVPPGESSVRVREDGPIVRVFTSRNTDLAAQCSNAAAYDEPDPNVAPFEPWPDPADGHRIRSYAVDDVEPVEGRFGRIYRCSTIMINWLYDWPGPRAVDQLSPHHHDDFEQLSLQLGGDFVHHIRTPWTTDLREWRDDEHRHCTSPSITVIPPPSIHTSQSIGDTSHFLVDVFAPPRHDFSQRPGWVLNADDYPAPPD